MTKTTIHDDAVEAMRDAQSGMILATLEDWLRAAPAREVRITCDARGFRVVLADERESAGESLRDAAAQVCTVLLVDAGEVQP